MPWTNKFKAALLQKDGEEKITALMREVPKEFASIEEMEEVRDLIGEAIPRIQAKKAQTLKTMNEIKKAKKFLLDNAPKKRRKLDITF